jgi:hypothetical protein
MKLLYAHNDGTFLRERLSFYQGLIETANENETNGSTETQMMTRISILVPTVPL